MPYNNPRPNPPSPFPERAGGVNRKLPLRFGEGLGGGVSDLTPRPPSLRGQGE